MEKGRIQNLSTDYNYSTIPVKILNDSKLSATAKGILAFLLSLPKNHNINKKDLTTYFKEGYYALNKAFEELVKHRIVHTIEVRDKKGHFKGFEYVVHEFPKKRFGDQKKVLPSRNYRKSDIQDSGDILLNNIFNEDCILTMSKMPDNYVDLVLTSPPYDNLRSYNGNNKFEFEKIAVELTRIIKNGGVIVWIVGDGVNKGGSETCTSFKQALFFKEYCGLRLHDTMIFEKNTTTYPAKPDGIRYTASFDYMFVFSKGKPKTVNLIADKKNRWSGTTNFGQKTDRNENDELIPVRKFKPIPEYSPRTNIWRYVTGNGYSTEDKIAHQHPAIFPEQLAYDHILTWTDEKDVVYDPFAGSGTVLKAAMINNRKFMGSEIVKEYFELVNKRLKMI
ncbi:MAG: site-specific DNA-methyltransferase [Prolixibacteraceae bacterium]|jgi:site-specific DNA-methyltransferase (adenine-specific)|nr:site-specific DNA-methyltransferase [Prolixibacteraceae bacterium]